VSDRAPADDKNFYDTNYLAWVRELAPFFLAKLRETRAAGDMTEHRRIWAMAKPDLRDEITRISKDNVQ
jgi:hypothetical protein